MKILVDCRCLNYPFLTGVNAYTIRLLHCLSSIKIAKTNLKFTAMGLKLDRVRELVNQFPFLLGLFDDYISLAKYLNYQDSAITRSNWFAKMLEVKLISQNRFDNNLIDDRLEKYDYIILPQPRLLKLHSSSKLISIFHDVFSILEKQTQFPQSLIFNRQTCQSLVNQSYRIVAGSISTCQDINRNFFDQTKLNNPKIRLIYPALPNLQELQTLQNLDLQDNEIVLNLSSKYILAISGIEPRKNWHNLLLAHYYLQQKHSWNLILVLSGSVVDQKYYSHLLELIQNKKIKNVIWKINISETQKNHLIKGCEFVVYPSFYEGFGFPILEAFEYNQAVVTSRISSMPEVGKEGCLYANPFDYVSIANCIYLLNSDTKLKVKLENNILKIKSQYSWLEMNQALDKLLI
jgi:glycosyltransferase involved in cell wall biosynthesis